MAVPGERRGPRGEGPVNENFSSGAETASEREAHLDSAGAGVNPVRPAGLAAHHLLLQHLDEAGNEINLTGLQSIAYEKVRQADAAGPVTPERVRGAMEQPDSPAAHILTANSLFGWECARTSVQMLYSIVTLADLNVGELQLLFAAAGLLSVLASVSFTLFLSSRCGSTVSSLAAALVFCVAPTVIAMTVPGPLSVWLCSILPASGTSIQASVLYAVTGFQFLSLGGLAVRTPYAMIAACAVEIPLFALLAVRAYCGHMAR